MPSSMTTKPHNYLDPIAAAEQPRNDFIRYLLTAYPLRDPHLRYGLKQQLEQPGTIWQYPYLEGSQPYQAAKSVEELAQLGVLHPARIAMIYRCFQSDCTCYFAVSRGCMPASIRTVREPNATPIIQSIPIVTDNFTSANEVPAIMKRASPPF